MYSAVKARLKSMGVWKSERGPLVLQNEDAAWPIYYPSSAKHITSFLFAGLDFSFMRNRARKYTSKRGLGEPKGRGKQRAGHVLRGACCCNSSFGGRHFLF